MKTYTFCYANQLEEFSEYTVEIPDFQAIYQSDIDKVQKLIEEVNEPETLEAALELLDGLQKFKEILDDPVPIEADSDHVLFLVKDKKVIDPGKQPPVRNKKPKTILKDKIRETLISTKIRMFKKSELARNSFDLGSLEDK